MSLNFISFFSSSSQSWISASKFPESIAFHIQAIIPAIIKDIKLFAIHQNVILIIRRNIHMINIFFLQNLSARAHDGTSKIVETIQTIVIKNNHCQKEKFK